MSILSQENSQRFLEEFLSHHEQMLLTATLQYISMLGIWQQNGPYCLTLLPSQEGEYTQLKKDLAGNIHSLFVLCSFPIGEPAFSFFAVATTLGWTNKSPLADFRNFKLVGFHMAHFKAVVPKWCTMASMGVTANSQGHMEWPHQLSSSPRHHRLGWCEIAQGLLQFSHHFEGVLIATAATGHHGRWVLYSQ